MIINLENTDKLAWKKMQGLIPCIVQDALNGLVLMQAYMNEEALQKTLNTNNVTFYSRSKKRLWMKGETSGNVLKLVELSSDCDNDCLIALVTPVGPACHTGTTTCWNDDAKPSLSYIFEIEKSLSKDKPEDLKKRDNKVIADSEKRVNELAEDLYNLLSKTQNNNISLENIINTIKTKHKLL